MLILQRNLTRKRLYLTVESAVGRLYFNFLLCSLWFICATFAAF